MREHAGKPHGCHGRPAKGGAHQPRLDASACAACGVFPRIGRRVTRGVASKTCHAVASADSPCKFLGTRLESRRGTVCRRHAGFMEAEHEDGTRLLPRALAWCVAVIVAHPWL